MKTLNTKKKTNTKEAIVDGKQCRVYHTRLMAASSSAPVYLNGILWRSISLKYSLASLDVLVPKPVNVEKRHVKLTFQVQKWQAGNTSINLQLYLMKNLLQFPLHLSHGNLIKTFVVLHSVCVPVFCLPFPFLELG